MYTKLKLNDIYSYKKLIVVFFIISLFFYNFDDKLIDYMRIIISIYPSNDMLASKSNNSLYLFYNLAMFMVIIFTLILSCIFYFKLKKKYINNNYFLTNKELYYILIFVLIVLLMFLKYLIFEHKTDDYILLLWFLYNTKIGILILMSTYSIFFGIYFITLYYEFKTRFNLHP